MSINVSPVRTGVSLVDGGFNVATGQNVANSGTTSMCAEFVLVLGIRDGKRIRSRQLEFGCVTSEASATLSDLVNGASIFASSIAAMSRGVVLSFYMKLGKYRNDEQMPQIGGEPLNTAVITLDNVNVTTDSGGVPISGIMPLRKVSQTIRVPWVGENVSLGTIKSTLEQVLAGGVCMGVTRFENDGTKTTIQAYKTNHKGYGKLVESDKVAVISLTNNDTALGDTDNIISEKYNEVIEAPNSLPTPPDHQPTLPLP